MRSSEGIRLGGWDFPDQRPAYSQAHRGGILGNMKLDELSEDGLEFRNAMDLNLKREIPKIFLTPSLFYSSLISQIWPIILWE